LFRKYGHDPDKLDEVLHNGVAIIMVRGKVEGNMSAIIPITDDHELFIGINAGGVSTMRAVSIREGAQGEDRVYDDPVSSMIATLLADVAISVHGMLAAMADTKKFIFEERPAKPFKPTKKRKSPLLHERSLFTVLSPKDCRRYLRVKDPEHVPAKGSKKAPHERRGHYRTYRSDRYVNKKGKTVYIAPIWVGQSETERGGKVYSVRLDL